MHVAFKQIKRKGGNPGQKLGRSQGRKISLAISPKSGVHNAEKKKVSRI